MSDGEKIFGKDATAGFLEQWKKHPLAIPVIIALLYFGFLLILIQGGVDARKIQLSWIAAAFSLLIFGIVVIVLRSQKFVFYNVTELVIAELNHNVSTIQEALANIQIGMGVAFDDIQAPPLSAEVTEIVKRFEVLTSVMERIGYVPELDDATKKALAKFYFRKSSFEKALKWIEKVKDKNDSDYNFIQGLTCWRRGDLTRSREFLSKSSHPRADYYKYVTYVSPYGGAVVKKQLDKFIDEISKETNPLYSDIYAQINLAVAHCRIAVNFSKEGTGIGVQSLQQALFITEHLIATRNHPFAYFNAACYISHLGGAKADLDHQRKYDKTNYTEWILKYLEKALAQKSNLVDNVISDRDLEWWRKEDESNYHCLVGKFYAQRIAGATK
jgi:tetratricopeptide (TPR) repeat protein